MCEPASRFDLAAILLAALMMASPALGAEGSTGARSSLVTLASSKFPNLTQCERAILEYADLNTMTRGDSAVCGPSSKFDDPSNDQRTQPLGTISATFVPSSSAGSSLTPMRPKRSIRSAFMRWARESWVQ